MRRFSILVLSLFLLTGCTHKKDPVDLAMEFRESIILSNTITFDAAITADYKDAIYQFELFCSADSNNNLTFTVNEPSSISGICGNINHNQQALTFDDKVLAFPPLSEGQITPVMAPYIFINSLRSGYISAGEKVGDGYCIYIDDTFQNNPLHVDIFTDENFSPIHAEITYQNFRILSIDVHDFVIL